VATSFIVACSATVLTLAMEKSSLLSSDFSLCFSDNCLLGWSTSQWRGKMLLFGLWVGAVCITGFNYAMQYIPPLVFSSVTLVDPAVTAFISWTAGIEHLPGIFSWLGGAVVVAGVAIISYGERKRREEEEGESAGEKAESKKVERREGRDDRLPVPAHGSNSDWDDQRTPLSEVEMRPMRSVEVEEEV